MGKVKKLDMALKYHVMPTHTQIFCYVCSFRLLLQICYILCDSEVIRLEIARVGKKIAKLWSKNLQVFAPQNVEDTDRAPFDLRYKITPHYDILAKVPRGGVLWPRRLERKKNITGVKHNGLSITVLHLGLQSTFNTQQAVCSV